MARDYLAIPATSAPAERAFSGGKNLISPKRCALGEEAIRACMCLKSWWGGGGLESLDDYDLGEVDGEGDNGF